MARVLFLNFSPRAKMDLSVHVGSSSGTANLVRALQSSGHEVISVISGEHKGELQAKAALGPLKRMLPGPAASLMSTLYDMSHNLSANRKLTRLRGYEGLHFVYERFAPFHDQAGTFARALGIPYLLGIHGPSADIRWFGPGYFEKTAAKIQEKVMGRADAIRVVSSAVKAHYGEKGVPSSKMHVIPNAGDTELFDPRSVTTDVRQKLGLDGKTVVGFVGSMHSYHGLPVLLKAASMVVSEMSEVRFLVVGPVNGHVEMAISENGSSKFFTFTDGVAYRDIPRYVMAMDICVIPDSNWYGSPIKLFEYGAMGKPVIAPRLRPIEDVVEHGRSALLFRQGDVKGLAEALLELATDESLRRSLGSNWMREVREAHTWNRRAEQVLEMYESVR